MRTKPPTPTRIKTIAHTCSGCDNGLSAAFIPTVVKMTTVKYSASKYERPPNTRNPAAPTTNSATNTMTQIRKCYFLSWVVLTLLSGPLYE